MIVCEPYLKYLRDIGCIVCLKPEPDVHHLLARGWRESKRDDFCALPLCREHHTEIEQVGVSKFQEKYQINVWHQAHHLLSRYLGALRSTAINDNQGLLGKEQTVAEGRQRG